MPTFKITAPDGTIIRVTGDSPPTEQEAESLYAAATPALKQPQQPPSESEAALSAFGGSLKAPFELAGAVGGAVTGMNPAPLSQMLQGMGQQSMGALRESVNPQLGTVERLGKLIESIPVAGPAITNLGQGLGGPLASALVEGKVATPQEEAGRGAAMGGLAGDLTLLGAGTAASKIGSALVNARRGAQGTRGMTGLGNEPTPIEVANRTLGVKPKNVEAGRNPGAQVLAQGIDLSADTRQIVSQISTKLDELVSVKKPAALQQWSVGTGEVLFEEQLGGDATFQVNKLLDKVVEDAARLGDKKLAKRAESMKDYVTDTRGKPLEDLTYQEADDLAHDLWRLKRDYMGGKRTRPLAAALEQAYGVINEALPPPVRELNTQIRDLVAAKDAASKKLLTERASHGPKGAKLEGETTALQYVRKGIRHAPPIGTTTRILKLLERALPGAE